MQDHNVSPSLFCPQQLYSASWPDDVGHVIIIGDNVHGFTLVSIKKDFPMLCSLCQLV